jgi:DNA-binding NtrC family response regulator
MNSTERVLGTEPIELRSRSRGVAGHGAQVVIGSESMRDVYAMVRRVARSRATVLVRGESGTGKELVARALHAESPRAGGPFVKVHCAALPDTLLESELFGYERGAFTGATMRKPGRVELAHGGTLFLDEIGDITPAMQVKLLRILQEREYERLGGQETLRADVRFVAVTHRDLERLVACGAFREDLFYRLAVVPIRVPPLRERRDDIRALVEHFVRASSAEGELPVRFEEAVIELLCQQEWPGNVRQLENFVERLVVLAEGPVVRLGEVLRELEFSACAPGDRTADGGFGGSLVEHRRAAEREALESALVRAGNNRTAAARVLGVSRRTLYKKMASLGVA